MRLALIALLVIGCSQAAPPRSGAPDAISPASAATETPTLNISTRPLGPLTSIESLTLSADGRHVSLRFTGGKHPADGLLCSIEYAAWTNQTDGVLEVGVFEVARTTPDELGLPANVVCTSEGHPRRLEVDLPAPFTGREWHDLAGYQHFLTAPYELVKLDVPDGWHLISERDVEASRTGRWERTYAQTEEAPRERSFVVYQAFDGPANVTGGSDPVAVEVNGRPATLYTWPATGDLVLVWTLDGDGLALVAHEPTFTIEDLIRLAESARVAD